MQYTECKHTLEHYFSSVDQTFIIFFRQIIYDISMIIYRRKNNTGHFRSILFQKYAVKIVPQLFFTPYIKIINIDKLIIKYFFNLRDLLLYVSVILNNKLLNRCMD